MDDKRNPTHLDSILRLVGSTSHYDAIFLLVFPPIGILALMGNIVSYRILTGRFFQKKPLYTYLRACCINSSVINFIFAITFICDSRRYFPFANSELATYFRCYLKIPILNTCFFFGSILDIVVALDRLVEFTRRFKHTLRRLDSRRLCGFLAIACVLLNTPYLFVFEPKKQLVQVGDRQTGRNYTQVLYFYGESEFALSFRGKILKYIQVAVRECVTLFLMLVINIVILILLRKKKLSSLRSDKKRSESVEQLKKSVSAREASNSQQAANLLAVTSPPNRRSSIDVTRRRSRLHTNVRQVNMMFVKMVFIICSFSSCEHIFLMLSHLLFTTYLKPIKLDIIFMANLSMLVNNSIHPFVFYYFNDFFRLRLRRRFVKFFVKEETAH